MKIIATVLAGILATTSNAQELCTCTDQNYHFTTENPDHEVYMEEYPWEVKYCVGSTVIVSLIGEDSPILDSYSLDEDGNQKLYYRGQWIRYDKFKPVCQDIPTS